MVSNTRKIVRCKIIRCKIAVIFIAFTLGSVFAVSAVPTGLSGAEIMQNMSNAQQAETSAMDIQMTLIDAGGDTSIRRFQTLVDSSGEQTKTITVFLSPESVKNTRFLSISDSGSQDRGKGQEIQWIYLPALRKVKRISAGERDSSFMGSDFTYADMGDVDNVDTSDHTLLGEEQTAKFSCYVVESTPHADNPSAYGKTITWVDKESWLAVRVLFYQTDRKTVQKELNCEALGRSGDEWYTRKVVMENKADGHRTIMEILQVRFGISLNPGYFTTAYLETGKVR
jgi:outer membrane lipoprotein-sorting protein